MTATNLRPIRRPSPVGDIIQDIGLPVCCMFIVLLRREISEMFSDALMSFLTMQQTFALETGV